MGHTSTYSTYEFELVVPILGANNKFKNTSRWNVTRIFNINTLSDNPVREEVFNWWNANARNNPNPKDNLKLILDIPTIRYTNTQLDNLTQFDANTTIQNLQALLTLQTETSILDLEPSTEPFIDIIPEIELEQIPVKPNNTLRNALLIGGALLIL